MSVNNSRFDDAMLIAHGIATWFAVIIDVNLNANSRFDLGRAVGNSGTTGTVGATSGRLLTRATSSAN